jgi:hypothetical protein
MTITHLDPQSGGSMPAGVASGEERVQPGVVGLSTAVVHAMFDGVHSKLAADGGVLVSSADIHEVDRIARRAEALRLALVAKADAQQAHRRFGHSSTSAWVAATTRSGGASAQRDVVLATALADGLDLTREAFQAGEVSVSNVGIVVRTMNKLPTTLSPVEREKVHTCLVRDAKQLNPGTFDRAAKVALAAAEKTAADVADHLEAQLLDEERRAYRSSTVTLRDLGNGTTDLRALLPTTVAGILRKVLQSMTAPRRDHLRHAAEAALVDGQTPAGCFTDGSVAADLLSATSSHGGPGISGPAASGTAAGTSFGTGAQATTGRTGGHGHAAFGTVGAGTTGATGRTAGTFGQEPSGTGATPATGASAAEATTGTSGHRVEGRNADWADIDWAHRRGRALTELIEHLDTEKLTGKVASTVIVTMTAEQVMGAAKAAQLQATVHELTGTLLPMSPSSAAATTDTGHLLSASAARRIACAADLIPAVLGGPSQILDLGRQNRFFNDHQRTALATLYESCAAADCDRPYAWSELHHEDPWSKGGLTDLDRAVPLCGYHHRTMHDPGYHHQITREVHAHGNSAGAKTVHFRLRT